MIVLGQTFLNQGTLTVDLSRKDKHCLNFITSKQ